MPPLHGRRTGCRGIDIAVPISRFRGAKGTPEAASRVASMMTSQAASRTTEDPVIRATKRSEAVLEPRVVIERGRVRLETIELRFGTFEDLEPDRQVGRDQKGDGAVPDDA